MLPALQQIQEARYTLATSYNPRSQAQFAGTPSHKAAVGRKSHQNVDLIIGNSLFRGRGVEAGACDKGVHSLHNDGPSTAEGHFVLDCRGLSRGIQS